MNFDAIFHAYKFNTNTINCFNSIKTHSPNTNIHVCVDGNGDYEQFVNQSSVYNIKNVIFHQNNILPYARFNHSSSPKIYFERILQLISLCDKEWILLLEDDVRLLRPITNFPATDAAGPKGHQLTSELIFNIESHTQKKLTNVNYGFCGGTMFKQNLFEGLDYKKLNFESLIALDSRIGDAGDILLTTLLYLNGKTYENWSEYGELNNPHEHNSNCSVLHNVKE